MNLPEAKAPAHIALVFTGTHKPFYQVKMLRHRDGETEIKKRKWGWIGRTLHKPAANITRQILDWNPQRRRKVGRPMQTRRRSIEAEAKANGMTWAERKRTSQNQYVGGVLLQPYAPKDAKEKTKTKVYFFNVLIYILNITFLLIWVLKRKNIFLNKIFSSCSFKCGI